MKQLHPSFLSLMFGLLCISGAAQARNTQDSILTARLLPGWQTSDQTHMAALQINLEQGWKTYWRSPGDAGIPPQFDWSGSQNLKAVIIHWPAPQLFNTNGLRSIGYKHDLTLPLELVAIDPAQPIHLSAAVDLGVCRDICMPAQINVDSLLPLVGQPDKVIQAALNAKPMQARAAGLKHITCEVEAITDGLALTARLDLPPQGAEEAVTFELPNPNIWVSESNTSREGNTLIAQTEFVPTTGEPFALNRSSLRVTVISDHHAVEITGCPN